MNSRLLTKQALVLIVSGFYSLSCIAASVGQSYFGFQYANTTYSEEGYQDVNPSAVVGKMGLFVNQGFAMEGRFGLGLSDDSINISGLNIALDIDSILGIYGVGHVHLNNTSSIYGLIGFSIVDLTASALGLSVSDDDSGASFGFGANFGISDATSLNIEYMQYLSTSDYDLDAISFGATFYF